MTAKRRRGRLRKSLLGAPSWVFRSRLGFVFGKRFICVEHEGRETAARHLTPLEVVHRDKDRNEYFVISARGNRADWYRNISKYPATAVYVGSRKRRVGQRMVPVDEAVAVMQIYQRAHEKAAKALLGLAGVSGADRVAWQTAMQRLPMVAFRPK